MKVYLGKNNIEILFQVEDTDIPKTLKIMEMMKTDGWKEYKAYQEQIRNEMIEMGKEGITRKITRDLSAEKWSKLYGFDISSSFVKAMIDGVQDFIDSRQKEEVHNDEQ